MAKTEEMVQTAINSWNKKHESDEEHLKVLIKGAWRSGYNEAEAQVAETIKAMKQEEYQKGLIEGSIVQGITDRIKLEQVCKDAKPKWISIEDRLPEEKLNWCSDNLLVLVEETDGNITWRNVYVGYYMHSKQESYCGWWVCMTCDCTRVGEHKYGSKVYKCDERVTHWMPLPELPKEE